MKYIDLGLPSGTLWADANEDDFYTFDEGVTKYGDSLPTSKQWKELKSHCKWEWIGNGYRVTGPNDNSIVLPAAGLRYCNGDVCYVGSGGEYWSSTSVGLGDAWGLSFNSSRVGLDDDCRCDGKSVRLVKNLKGGEE